MLLRSIAVAVIALAVNATATAAGEVRNVLDVFRDFEAICFSYAVNGNSLDLALLIEQSGFTFAHKAHDGSDVYDSDIAQLVIGEKVCALGMSQLPFRQMSEWTAQWADVQHLADAMVMPNPAGPQFRIWSGMGFDVRLQEDKFSDGTALTGLILVRK